MAEQTLVIREDWVGKSDWTDDEIMAVALMVGAALHPEPFSEDDVRRFTEWADGIRSDVALITNVLQGITTVRWDGAEWRFALTSHGWAIAEAMRAKA